MNPAITNFILFQVGWFACVISSANNTPVIGSILALGIIGMHILRAIKPVKELSLIGIAMFIGLIWDSILVQQGWLNYTSGTFIEGAAPYWIVIMWGLFATTLNISLHWLKDRIFLAIIFGAIAGPLAYYAGQRLGAVHFISHFNALTALSIGWAVFTPVLIFFSNLLDGYQIHRIRSAT